MIFVKNSRGGREGGQHDQPCVKNECLKDWVGGRGSTSIWIMSLNILGFFMAPLSYKYNYNCITIII